jgi:murein DD-endopeptidase MepM/ murein hydrolase activator NlpD
LSATALLFAGSGTIAAGSAPSLPVPTPPNLLPTPSPSSSLNVGVPGLPGTGSTGTTGSNGGTGSTGSAGSTAGATGAVPAQPDPSSPQAQQQREQYEQQQAQVQTQLPDYYAQYGAQALQLSSNDGPFAWPELTTMMSQGFGCTEFLLEPQNPSCPTRHWHTGVDVVGPAGAPVFAAASGIARTFPGSVGYGNFVIIIHSDHYATLYGHLQTFLIRDGDPVIKGDIIGLEGSTGFSTGPHLHFEIRHDNDYLDPLSFFMALPGTGGRAVQLPQLPAATGGPDRKSRNLERY